MSEVLIRFGKVLDKTGYKKSMAYEKVENGLLPPQIKISERASAWVESEIDAVISARIAGKNDDEIRTLVRELVSKR